MIGFGKLRLAWSRSCSRNDRASCCGNGEGVVNVTMSEMRGSQVGRTCADRCRKDNVGSSADRKVACLREDYIRFTSQSMC